MNNNKDKPLRYLSLCKNSPAPRSSRRGERLNHQSYRVKMRGKRFDMGETGKVLEAQEFVDMNPAVCLNPVSRQYHLSVSIFESNASHFFLLFSVARHTLFIKLQYITL